MRWRAHADGLFSLTSFAPAAARLNRPSPPPHLRATTFPDSFNSSTTTSALKGRAFSCCFCRPRRCERLPARICFTQPSSHSSRSHPAKFLASLRLGLPSPTVAATTIGWLAFALPATLPLETFLSVTMPYRVNLGCLGRQSGSQANALLSMFIQTAWLARAADHRGLCAVLGKLWMGAIILAVLAVGAVIAWMLVLRRADSIINTRRDKLIARLTKTA